MFRKIFLSYIFFAIALASNAQHLGFRLLDDRKKVEIPFQLHKNLIIIPIILNNKLPLHFILDTGVRNAILFDKVYAELLDLQYSRKYTISGPGTDVTVDAYIANNLSFRLPGVEGTGHAMVVLEEDILELNHYLGVTIHGIIGYELFSRFVVDINYSEQLITLTLPEYFRPERNYDVVPMVVEDTKPYIFACLTQQNDKEKEIKLMIDSGSSQSLIIQLESDSIDLHLPEKTIYRSIGRGLGGQIKGYIGRVPALGIGKTTFKEVIVNYPEKEFYADEIERYSTNRNGTIGGEILKRFNVVFDFNGNKFYYKKNLNFYNDFTYNLSGLLIKAEGPVLDTYIVDEVEEGSAGSDAGILAGDTIISINRRSASSCSFDEILSMLNDRDGKKMRLVVIRGGKEKVIRFRLKSVI